MTITVEIPDNFHTSRKGFESLGFSFSGNTRGGCVTASIPQGWQVVELDGSDLASAAFIDESGRRRGEIVACVGFGYVRLLDFFSVDDAKLDNGTGCVQVRDGNGLVMWESDHLPIHPEHRHALLQEWCASCSDWWAKRYDAIESAKVWLNANFPNWRNEMAYWDEFQTPPK